MPLCNLCCCCCCCCCCFRDGWELLYASDFRVTIIRVRFLLQNGGLDCNGECWCAFFFVFLCFISGREGGGCPEEGAVAVDAPQLVQRRKEEEDARLCEGKCKFLQCYTDLRVSFKRLMSAL